MIKRLRRVAGAVLAAADWAAVACLCALVVLTNLQVYYRYVLDNPLAWPEELARNLFIWAVYLGLVKVFRSEGHYRIDVLVRPLPARLRAAVGLGAEPMLGKSGVWFATLSEISDYVRRLIAEGTWTPRIERALGGGEKFEEEGVVPAGAFDLAAGRALGLHLAHPGAAVASSAVNANLSSASPSVPSSSSPRRGFWLTAYPRSGS